MFSRYFAMYTAVAVLAVNTAFLLFSPYGMVWLSVVAGMLLVVGIYDLFQKKHAVLRNYPIIGHFRYMIESIRPELRQYIVERDDEKLPFSRHQRDIVYRRAKGEPEAQSFGTKVDVLDPQHRWIIHSMAPTTLASHDFRVKVGAERKQPYSISLLNISAMSFGSLSGNAIKALNKGAQMGGFAHDTGEGSVSPYHLEHGGDLIWEIGSGYFGCRTAEGAFDPVKFSDTARMPNIKMIEIKLSQGAKPGHGGVLPAAKITQEIATTRGIPMGQDCISPAAHSAFDSPLSLMAFIQTLRTLSGDKPVGFKLCIGQPWEWFGICKAMQETGVYPDFIVVDGSEGGTGAAPMEFADHVGMPLQEGLQLVHNSLVGLKLRSKVKIGASGKIITAFDILNALALGADWVNSGRGFLFSLGCIQALGCSSGNCPTGIATQDPQRQKALVVEDKAQRVQRFHDKTLHAVMELTQAAGLNEPGDITPNHIMLREHDQTVISLSDKIRSDQVAFSILQPFDPLSHTYPKIYTKWWARSATDKFGLNT